MSNNTNTQELERRIDALHSALALPDWPSDYRQRLFRRLQFIAGDELTAPDIRVIVRLYNREIIGRERHRLATSEPPVCSED